MRCCARSVVPRYGVVINNRERVGRRNKAHQWGSSSRDTTCPRRTHRRGVFVSNNTRARPQGTGTRKRGRCRSSDLALLEALVQQASAAFQTQVLAFCERRAEHRQHDGGLVGGDINVQKVRDRAFILYVPTLR
eukprot:3875219-Pleurochrysis_carterae.AAC.8